MTYSPYNNDSSCRSAADVLSDIQLIASKRVQTIRVYDTSCDTLYTVIPALKQFGLKLIQGFYITSDGVDSIDSQVTDFTTWLSADNSNAQLVELLVVGNEAISNVFPFSIMLT
jgi:exo-beta-1,3-glucanase (GH17 family)